MRYIYLVIFVVFSSSGAHANEIVEPKFCRYAARNTSIQTLIVGPDKTNEEYLRFPIWNLDVLIKNFKDTISFLQRDVRRPESQSITEPIKPLKLYTAKLMPEGGLLNYTQDWFGAKDSYYLFIPPFYGVSIQDGYKFMFSGKDPSMNGKDKLFIVNGPVDITAPDIAVDDQGIMQFLKSMVEGSTLPISGLKGFGIIKNGSDIDKALTSLINADLVHVVPDSRVFTTTLFKKDVPGGNPFPDSELQIYEEEANGIFKRLCRLRYEYGKDVQKKGAMFKQFCFNDSYETVKARLDKNDLIDEKEKDIFTRFIRNSEETNFVPYDRYLISRYSLLNDPWYIVFSFSNDQLQQINLLCYPLTFTYQYKYLDANVGQDSLGKSVVKREFKDIFDIFNKEKGIDYEWVKKQQAVLGDKNSALSIFNAMAAADGINILKKKTSDLYVCNIFDILKKAEYTFDYDPLEGEAFFVGLRPSLEDIETFDPFRKDMGDSRFRIFSNKEGFKYKVFTADSTFFEKDGTKGYKEYNGYQDLPSPKNNIKNTDEFVDFINSPTLSLSDAFKKGQETGRELANSNTDKKNFKPVRCDVIGIEIYDQHSRFKTIYERDYRELMEKTAKMQKEVSKIKADNQSATQKALDDFQSKK